MYCCPHGSTVSVSQWEHLRGQPWTTRGLRTALQHFTRHIEDPQLRLCLFIDGLDEYIGDEFVLVEDFKLLTASSNIKICTSSRPRNLFESAFVKEQQPWKLTLHEWTKPDITEMVRLRLQDNQAFVELVASEKQRLHFVETSTRRLKESFVGCTCGQGAP